MSECSRCLKSASIEELEANSGLCNGCEKYDVICSQAERIKELETKLQAAHRHMLSMVSSDELKRLAKDARDMAYLLKGLYDSDPRAHDRYAHNEDFAYEIEQRLEES